MNAVPQPIVTAHYCFHCSGVRRHYATGETRDKTGRRMTVMECAVCGLESRRLGPLAALLRQPERRIPPAPARTRPDALPPTRATGGSRVACARCAMTNLQRDEDNELVCLSCGRRA